jgi:D-alanyl-lipoteichoic acid acyltransferase DltB (MBOAT superfamily)
MLFNSYAYLLLFLPLCLAGFYWLRSHLRFEGSLIWLNLCSVLFYGLWNVHYVPLLLASIAINFQFGKWLHQYQNQPTGKRILILAITLNLAALAWFKYTGFAITSFNSLTGATLHDPGIILPLAISFFTFNQITYLVDAYEGMSEKYSFNQYSLFVTFFPHLLAGPIVHHRELIPQFLNNSAQTSQSSNMAIGITAISFGLFKKVIFADALSGYVDQVYQGIHTGIPLTATEAWIGALSFNLQVYFDFSGYCDIACGSALLFGIILPQNFISPFKTANIIEFWKHWHITLSRFITSYVYTPLMRNTVGGITFKKAMLITIISMGISGLWHGAGLTFVAWGFMHGIMLVINHCWRKIPAVKKIAGIKAYKLLSILLTYVMVTLAMVLFRAPDIHSAATMYSHLFDFNNFQFTHQLQQPVISDLCRQFKIELSPMQKILPIMLLMHAWIWLLPSLQQVMAKQHFALSSIRLPETRFLWQSNNRWLVLTAVILTTALMATSQTGDFVYFQF